MVETQSVYGLQQILVLDGNSLLVVHVTNNVTREEAHKLSCSYLQGFESIFWNFYAGLQAFHSGDYNCLVILHGLRLPVTLLLVLPEVQCLMGAHPHFELTRSATFPFDWVRVHLKLNLGLVRNHVKHFSALYGSNSTFDDTFNFVDRNRQLRLQYLLRDNCLLLHRYHLRPSFRIERILIWRLYVS